MSDGPKVLIEAEHIKAFDLDTCLLRDRKVFLGDEVNNETSNALIKQLLYLESEDPKAPITLFINTPGGSIVDGMAVYDTIQRISCPVHAVVSGMAASMGSVILSGCEKGERAIMRHGEVLLHQPLGGARGPATDIEISAKRILKMKQTLLQILADNCGQSYDRLLEDCDRDHWLGAEESLEYGIADKILE